MRVLRPRLSGVDLALPLLGGAATLAVSYMAVEVGAQISVGVLVAIAGFVAAVIAFVAYSHIAVAATVVIFATIPALKVFVAPELGALKDAIFLAAVVAALVVFVVERRRPDRYVLGLVALLLALYIVNVGGGHGVTWAQGVRLVGEPLLLLLVGLTLPNPQRTFRWAMGALIVTCSLVALYGLGQQLVGKWSLVDWGYSFDREVRSLSGGQLRSFGTLDDPFAYAALLSFGMAGVLFWLRRGPLAWTAGLIILTGLGFSFVRTAVLFGVAFLGLALRRLGYHVTAVLLVGAIAVAGVIILARAGGTEGQTQTYAVSSSAGESGESLNVILNGRVSAWETALGSNPAEWLLGRGVGEVGTAAARSSFEVSPTSDESETENTPAVDSGYLAAIADVGIVGLIVLVLLLGRLLALAGQAAWRQRSEGWVALGLLAVLLLDALTRASFTGFPTAFLCLLLVGICIATANEDEDTSAGGGAR